MNANIVNTARIANRAPRGGAVSPVNGRFYAGGRFMPMVADPNPFRPGPPCLMGSSRQVAWGNRLRREAIARLDEEIAVRVSNLYDGDPKSRAIRATVRRMLIARHNMMTERSAAAFIDARMAA